MRPAGREQPHLVELKGAGRSWLAVLNDRTIGDPGPRSPARVFESFEAACEWASIWRSTPLVTEHLATLKLRVVPCRAVGRAAPPFSIGSTCECCGHPKGVCWACGSSHVPATAGGCERCDKAS